MAGSTGNSIEIGQSEQVNTGNKLNGMVWWDSRILFSTLYGFGRASLYKK